VRDSEAEVLSEFWRPEGLDPCPWLVKDGILAVSSARGCSFLTASALLADLLGIPSKRVLRWTWAGFAEAGMGYLFGQAVEDLEAPALKRRSEQVLLRRRTRPLGAEQGQFELSGG
jgi:hypothetical protein